MKNFLVLQVKPLNSETKMVSPSLFSVLFGNRLGTES